MIAMCLDPRTKSATGIPLADREVIWEYVFDDLVDIAFQSGPPQLLLHLQFLHKNNHYIGEEIGTITLDMHVMLMIFCTENMNEHGHVDDEDDLQELIDANDDTENLIGDAVENWNRETVGGMIRTEMDLYKSAKGLKLTDP
jgi:hypothetical protein